MTAFERPHVPHRHCRFVINAADSARMRWPLTRCTVTDEHDARSLHATVILPASYRRAGRRRYPLLVLADAREQLGSAIEMSRAVSATRETRECIIVCHDDPWLAPEDAGREAAHLERIVDGCRRTFRVQAGEVAMFVGSMTAAARVLLERKPQLIDRWIVAQTPASLPFEETVARVARRGGRPRIAWTGRSTPSSSLGAAALVRVLPEASVAGLVMPALIHGIRSFWGTTHAYGSELVPLGWAPVSRALRSARPLIGRVRRQPAAPPVKESRHILRSEVLDRDFEIFVSLPAGGRRPDPGYAAVIALDANATWSTVSELASRMADAGEIEQLVMIGIGVPHEEGEVAFGLRRFEEFSPPADDRAFAGTLGHIFTSIFASFGQDARAHFGRAPDFHRFLADELVPELLGTLPLDPQRLCLAGHSAGGTYVGYERAQHDSPFSRFVIMSPGVAISDHWMLKADGGLRHDLPLRSDTIVTIGGAERDNAFNRLAGIPLAEQYASRLAEAGKGHVEFHDLEGDTHTSVFSRAFALALTRHFPGDRASWVEN